MEFRPKLNRSLDRKIEKNGRIIILPGENGLLQETHESGGRGQSEDHQSAVDVQGHVGGAERVTDAGEEERDEAKEPLEGEADDGRQADPAVQRVQIVDGRLGQIVRVKDGLESDGGQQKGRHHHDGVKTFQLLLRLVTQQTVHQNA